MPKGPNGQKRPADAIGLAVMVGKIATGEIEDNHSESRQAARESSGGRARAAALTETERVKIAKKGATARWEKAPVVPAEKERS